MYNMMATQKWIGGWQVSEPVWMLWKREKYLACQKLNPNAMLIEPIA
jgi:hypothetical protein